MTSSQRPGRILRAQEFGRNGDQWHRLYAGMPPGSAEAPKVNAVDLTEPLAPYEMMCGLLVPLYAPRAAEEVLFGRRGVTLQTAREVCWPPSGFQDRTVPELRAPCALPWVFTSGRRGATLDMAGEVCAALLQDVH